MSAFLRVLDVGSLTLLRTLTCVSLKALNVLVPLDMHHRTGTPTMKANACWYMHESVAI